jgi:hypothetical protein
MRRSSAVAHTRNVASGPDEAKRNPGATRPFLNGPKRFHTGFINGLPGFVTPEADGEAQTTASDIEDGKFTAIHVARNLGLAAAFAFVSENIRQGRMVATDCLLRRIACQERPSLQDR